MHGRTLRSGLWFTQILYPRDTCTNVPRAVLANYTNFAVSTNTSF